MSKCTYQIDRSDEERKSNRYHGGGRNRYAKSSSRKRGKRSPSASEERDERRKRLNMIHEAVDEKNYNHEDLWLFAMRAAPAKQSPLA